MGGYAIMPLPPHVLERFEKDELELEKIYFLARTIWPYRIELTSNSKYSWAKWFEERIGVSLIQFSEWAKEKNLKEKFKRIQKVE